MKRYNLMKDYAGRPLNRWERDTFIPGWLARVADVYMVVAGAVFFLLVLTLLARL